MRYLRLDFRIVRKNCLGFGGFSRLNLRYGFVWKRYPEFQCPPFSDTLKYHTNVYVFCYLRIIYHITLLIIFPILDLFPQYIYIYIYIYILIIYIYVYQLIWWSVFELNPRAAEIVMIGEWLVHGGWMVGDFPATICYKILSVDGLRFVFGSRLCDQIHVWQTLFGDVGRMSIFVDWICSSKVIIDG